MDRNAPDSGVEINPGQENTCFTRQLTMREDGELYHMIRDHELDGVSGRQVPFFFAAGSAMLGIALERYDALLNIGYGLISNGRVVVGASDVVAVFSLILSLPILAISGFSLWKTKSFVDKVRGRKPQPLKTQMESIESNSSNRK